MMGAATGKARLPKFSLVLGIDICCEVDDLSCLGMLEKCKETSQIRCHSTYPSTDGATLHNIPQMAHSTSHSPDGATLHVSFKVDRNNVRECDQFKQLWHSRITCDVIDSWL